MKRPRHACYFLPVLISLLNLQSVSAAEAEFPPAAAAARPAEVIGETSKNGPAAEAGDTLRNRKIEFDRFCAGIVDVARERRYYLKDQEINALLEKLKTQTEILSKKQNELERWVQKREEFGKKASQKLVEIYANMKPDASAPRIAGLEAELAASLLLSIPPRQASAILNEMDESVAIDITSIMAASARKKDPS